MKQQHFHYPSFFLLLLLIGFSSCQSTAPEQKTADNPKVEEATPKPALPKALAQGLEAHGGLERWEQMKSLQFAMMKGEKKETHLTQLKNRKTRISHEDYTIGFDGEEVWVAPNKAAFGKGSARFYHNLRFYFFGLPFLFADPGINYEELPQKEINGIMYDAVKISYQSGVGDAPEDYYIAHFHPETHLMDVLLYTVTYYKGTTNENYNALMYEWQEVNGLKVPKVMSGYKYENGQIGELRYERPLLDVEIKETAPDEALFEMPEGAEIDSLITHE